jgi:hypothetical protein
MVCAASKSGFSGNEPTTELSIVQTLTYEFPDIFRAAVNRVPAVSAGSGKDCGFFSCVSGCFWYKVSNGSVQQTGAASQVEDLAHD